MDGSGARMALPWLHPSLHPCHAGHGSEASGALGNLCMKAHHEMKESTTGFLFHFVSTKDYFLYFVAFERGLWLNHRMDISPNACLLLSSFPFSYLLYKMLRSISVWSANNSQQLKRKRKKFQMSTPIWLILLIVGLYKIVLSVWGRFLDKKTWTGIEENAVVQKVLHIMFKIRLKQ